MGERGSGLVATNGQPLVVNEKLRKIKVVYLTILWFDNLLRMDGSKALCVTGLPEGAECIGNTPIVQTEQGPAIGMIYYHENFPMVLEGQMPPVLALKVEELDVEPREATLTGGVQPNKGSAAE